MEMAASAPSAALSAVASPRPSDGDAWTSFDNSSVPLKVICKGQQYASTESAKEIVAFRGRGAFVCDDARIAAHMDQGLLTDPDVGLMTETSRLPWQKVQLNHLVLLKVQRKVTPTPEAAAAAGAPIEPVWVTQFQVFWRRVVKNDAKPDDLYGMRLIKLSALKTIFKGGTLQDAPSDRYWFLCHTLNLEERAIWQDFSEYAKEAKFASGLSVNLVEHLRECEEAGSAALPFKLRMLVEPGWTATRPRSNSSRRRRFAAPGVGKSADVVEVPTAETLVHPPPHVMPIPTAPRAARSAALRPARVGLYPLGGEHAHRHGADGSLKRPRSDDGPAPDSLIPAKESARFKTRRHQARRRRRDLLHLGAFERRPQDRGAQGRPGLVRRLPRHQPAAARRRRRGLDARRRRPVRAGGYRRRHARA